MILWLLLELLEEKVVEACEKSMMQRRKIGVLPWFLEVPMKRPLRRQAAVEVLPKEVWREPCRMHLQRESRKLAVAVSILVSTLTTT